MQPFTTLGGVAAGSSAPSGLSGSAFTHVPGLGSLPAHAIDTNRSAPGETSLFTGQVSSKQLECQNRLESILQTLLFCCSLQANGII